MRADPADPPLETLAVKLLHLIVDDKFIDMAIREF
jgi:hypothetical protein